MSADIDERASRWHLAQADDGMDWAAFTKWLEADPRHREAYDAIALLDDRIDAARPQLVELVRPDAAPRGWRSLRLVAVAAAGAVLMVLVMLHLVRPTPSSQGQTTAYTAPAGQPRSIRLMDGSTATLAAGSVLRVPDARGKPLALEGQAFFDVRHDPATPFTVRAGDYEIQDVGTRFDVSMAGGMLRVAVAEGRVALRADGKTVEIGAGQAAIARPGAHPEILRARLDAMGAWRRGSMDYDNVPLAIVAADIARLTGQAVTIDAATGQRRFSGVLTPADRASMVSTLGALAGLKTRMDRNAIHLGDGAER